MTSVWSFATTLTFVFVVCQQPENQTQLSAWSRPSKLLKQEILTTTFVENDYQLLLDTSGWVDATLFLSDGSERDLVLKILPKKLVARAYFHLGRHRTVEPDPFGEAGFS